MRVIQFAERGALVRPTRAAVVEKSGSTSSGGARTADGVERPGARRKRLVRSAEMFTVGEQIPGGEKRKTTWRRGR
jgi:hypothetical protein